MPPPPLRTNEERRAEVERLFSEFAPKFPGAPEITAEKLMRDLASEGKPVVVVDVRTEAEQDVSVIASALRKSDFEARITVGSMIVGERKCGEERSE